MLYGLISWNYGVSGTVVSTMDLADTSEGKGMAFS